MLPSTDAILLDLVREWDGCSCLSSDCDGVFHLAGGSGYCGCRLHRPLLWWQRLLFFITFGGRQHE